MPSPLFSIVIPCRNAEATIEATLESIRFQTDRQGVEVVVVDGASTDSTASIVDRFRDIVTIFISEPDDGVYFAMNKGARVASGKWYLFMGANDTLASPDVFAQVRGFLEEGAGGVYCGEAAYSDGRVWRAPVSPSVRYRNFMHHQSSFYHRSLFMEKGYDETFRIQADYDFNLRLWQNGVRPVPIPLRVAVCACGGLSDGGRWENYRDEIKVRHRHFPALQCWLWDLGSIARYMRKTFLRYVGV
jgi:glycosyltransferase involved in cell wall biosynthesis